MTPPAYGKLHFPFNILYFLYSFSFSPLPFHSYNKVQNKVSFSSFPFSNFVWIKRSSLRKFPRPLWSLDRIYSWKSFESRARKVEDEAAVTTVRFATRTEDGRIGRREVYFLKMGWTLLPREQIQVSWLNYRKHVSWFLLPRGSRRGIDLLELETASWKLVGLSSRC